MTPLSSMLIRHGPTPALLLASVRWIPFFTSRHFFVFSATWDLCLRSDHRARIANLTSRQLRACRWTKLRTKRGWQASGDFHNEVIKALSESDISTLVLWAQYCTQIHLVDDRAKP